MKTLLVTGTTDPRRTYPWRARFKELGGWWRDELQGWTFPESARERLEECVTQDGGLTLREIDPPPPSRALFIPKQGTYPFRADLHSLGGRYSRPRDGWLLPVRNREYVERFAQVKGLAVQEIVIEGPTTRPAEAVDRKAVARVETPRDSQAAESDQPSSSAEFTTTPPDDRQPPAPKASSPGRWLVIQNVTALGDVPVREIAPDAGEGQDRIIAELQAAEGAYQIVDHAGRAVATSKAWQLRDAETASAVRTSRGWVGRYVDSEGGAHYTTQAFPSSELALEALRPLQPAPQQSTEAKAVLPSAEPRVEIESAPRALAPTAEPRPPAPVQATADLVNGEPFDPRIHEFTLPEVQQLVEDGGGEWRSVPLADGETAYGTNDFFVVQPPPENYKSDMSRSQVEDGLRTVEPAEAVVPVAQSYSERLEQTLAWFSDGTSVDRRHLDYVRGFVPDATFHRRVTPALTTSTTGIIVRDGAGETRGFIMPSRDDPPEGVVRLLAGARGADEQAPQSAARAEPDAEPERTARQQRQEPEQAAPPPAPADESADELARVEQEQRRLLMDIRSVDERFEGLPLIHPVRERLSQLLDEQNHRYAQAWEVLGERVGAEVVAKLREDVEAITDAEPYPLGTAPEGEEYRFRGSTVEIPVRTDGGVQWRRTTVERVLNQGDLVEVRNPVDPEGTVRLEASSVRTIRRVDSVREEWATARLLEADSSVDPDDYRYVGDAGHFLAVERRDGTELRLLKWLPSEGVHERSERLGVEVLRLRRDPDGRLDATILSPDDIQQLRQAWPEWADDMAWPSEPVIEQKQPDVRVAPFAPRTRPLTARQVAKMVEDAGDEWLRVPLPNGKVAYGTTHFVVVQPAPPETHKDIPPDVVSKALDKAEPAQRVVPVAQSRSEIIGRMVVWYSNGTCVDRRYHDYISQFVRGATFHRQMDREQTGAVVVRDADGETCGLIMPLMEDPPEGVERILAQHAALYSTNRRVEREIQPAPTTMPKGPTGPDDALKPGTTQLADKVLHELWAGKSIDNRGLAKLAGEAFGGTRRTGTYDPRDAYDAVEAAVSRWVLGSAPAISDQAPEQTLKSLQSLLARLPRQTDRTREQDAYQQFSTPPTIAFLAARLANISKDDVVLEPSAGVGSLASFAKAAGARTYVNELAPRRAALLRELGFEATSVDAELLNDLLPDDIRPNVVLMNPPFSSTAGRLDRNRTRYGGQHVLQALARLEAGGRLVAILGEGMAIDRPMMRGWWTRVMDAHDVRLNIGLPGDSYGKYGTTFGVQLILIEKHGPTPGKTFAERVGNVRWGKVDSLEEALQIVHTIVRKPRELEVAQAVQARDDDRAPVTPVEPAPDVGVSSPIPPQPAEQAQEVAPVSPTAAPVDDAAEVAADVLEEPGRAHEPVRAERDRVAEADGTAYALYRPIRLEGQNLAEHPARIVESATMAAVDPPEISYQSSLPQAILTEGRLSAIQYEAVLYAGQRHQQKLPNGARGAFALGDGTGVGKGRVVAATILDNWNQGRRRALWLSVSNDLMEAAERDLLDLGVPKGEIPLRNLRDFKPCDPIDLQHGVVFATYAALIGVGRTQDADGNTVKVTRREQLQRWLGEEPVLIFDEAHSAKNAYPDGRAKPTQTGEAVLQIQEEIPGARILYVSATGATSVRNLAYMTRLGLWGEGTAFPGGFQEFLVEIDGGGIGAMEMVCRDLKALGLYASRSISFSGVEYREAHHQLTPQQREIYNTAAEAWQLALADVEAALEVTGGAHSSTARRWSMTSFWGAHQRFFKQLTTAIQVPTCIRETEAALARGNSVVIGVISTGEAGTESRVSEAVREGYSLDDLDFTPREILGKFVERCFPTDLYQEVMDPVTRKTSFKRVEDAAGNPVQSRAALAIKNQLLDRISDMSLPDNPLDQVINHFGEDAVAELTGRKRRLIRDPATGRMDYKRRVPEGVAMAKANLYEMAQFQDGKKRIAIISNAASTGISLHASRREGNQQRRTHITLELGWSADRQLQQFGRTHRSDQAFPPEYVLLSSDVGGQRRFSSTIARRLASLGALTKGQRDATGAGTLEQYNFETSEGRAALEALYKGMLHGFDAPGIDRPLEVLERMGLIAEGSREMNDADLRDVTRFLNRVLALDLDTQNAVFDQFVQLYEQTVQHAREAGTFDRGVEDIEAIEIRVVSTKVVHTDPVTKADTTHFELDVDCPTHPSNWEEIMGFYNFDREHCRGDEPGFYRQVRSGHIVYACRSGSSTQAASGRVERNVQLHGPTGDRRYLPEGEFCEHYELVQPKDAREWWVNAVAKIPPVHTRRMHIIGGAILPLWERLKTAEAQQLTPVRTTTADGRRVVGIQIPQAQIGRVLQAIGVDRSLRDNKEVWWAVRFEGTEVPLAAGLSLSRVPIHGEPRVELRGITRFQFEMLRGMGLTEERIDYRIRFFVPESLDDEQSVPSALEALLDRYPALEAVAATRTKPGPGKVPALEPPAELQRDKATRDRS